MAERARPAPPSFLGTTINVTVEDKLPTAEQARARLRLAMQRAVGVALAAAQRQAPRRTGRLAAGLRGTVADAPGGGLVGVVDADKTRRHIARFLELGTAQHVITARRGGRRRRRGARALVFEGVGGLRFAMRVRHPGIRARHWLQTAGLAATPSIVAAFQEAMRDVAGAR